MKLVKRSNLLGQAPDPNTLEGLRFERDMLRKIVETLNARVPCNNDQGSPRRQIISLLLTLCARPDRRKVDSDILDAARMILSYNDRPAVALLTIVAEEDYQEWIKKVKGEILTRR